MSDTVNDFTPSLIRHVREKLPKDILNDYSDGHKLLILLDNWHNMKNNMEEAQKKLEDVMKELEYTLNVLNVAESNLGNEHHELKKIITDWLDYYRNLSKQEK
jgi:predicted nuclease with TOPRIM domain